MTKNNRIHLITKQEKNYLQTDWTQDIQSTLYNTSTEDTYKVLGLFGVWTGRDLAAQPFVGYSNCKQARQDQAVENIRLPQWHQHILPTCGGPLHNDSGFTFFSLFGFKTKTQFKTRKDSNKVYAKERPDWARSSYFWFQTSNYVSNYQYMKLVFTNFLHQYLF